MMNLSEITAEKARVLSNAALYRERAPELRGAAGGVLDVIEAVAKEGGAFADFQPGTITTAIRDTLEARGFEFERFRGMPDAYDRDRVSWGIRPLSTRLAEVVKGMEGWPLSAREDAYDRVSKLALLLHRVLIEIPGLKLPAHLREDLADLIGEEEEGQT